MFCAPLSGMSSLFIYIHSTQAIHFSHFRIKLKTKQNSPGMLEEIEVTHSLSQLEHRAMGAAGAYSSFADGMLLLPFVYKDKFLQTSVDAVGASESNEEQLVTQHFEKYGAMSRELGFGCQCIEAGSEESDAFTYIKEKNQDSSLVSPWQGVPERKGTDISDAFTDIKGVIAQNLDGGSTVELSTSHTPCMVNMLCSTSNHQPLEQPPSSNQHAPDGDSRQDNVRSDACTDIKVSTPNCGNDSTAELATSSTSPKAGQNGPQFVVKVSMPASLGGKEQCLSNQSTDVIEIKSSDSSSSCNNVAEDEHQNDYAGAQAAHTGISSESETSEESTVDHDSFSLKPDSYIESVVSGSGTLSQCETSQDEAFDCNGDDGTEDDGTEDDTIKNDEDDGMSDCFEDNFHVGFLKGIFLVEAATSDMEASVELVVESSASESTMSSQESGKNENKESRKVVAPSKTAKSGAELHVGFSRLNSKLKSKSLALQNIHGSNSDQWNLASLSRDPDADIEVELADHAELCGSRVSNE